MSSIGPQAPLPPPYSEDGLRHLHYCGFIYKKSHRILQYTGLILFPLSLLSYFVFPIFPGVLLLTIPALLGVLVLFTCLLWRMVILLIYFTRYTLLQLMLTIFVFGSLGVWINKTSDTSWPIAILFLWLFILFAWVHQYDPIAEDFGKETATPENPTHPPGI